MSKLHDELWAKYRHPLAGHEWLLGTEYADFAAAIDEAMERQREACAEAWMKHAFDELTYESRRKVSPTYAAILSAKVEDNA